MFKAHHNDQCAWTVIEYRGEFPAGALECSVHVCDQSDPIGFCAVYAVLANMATVLADQLDRNPWMLNTPEIGPAEPSLRPIWNPLQ